MGLLTKEQYRVQLEETKKWLEDSIKINRELSGRNGELEAELAEARRDTARLNWWFGSREHGSNFLDIYFNGVSNMWTVDQWKEAIDAAMKDPNVRKEGKDA